MKLETFRYVARIVDDGIDDIFNRLVEIGLDRDSGYTALIDYGYFDLADGWQNWWDEGEE